MARALHIATCVAVVGATGGRAGAAPVTRTVLVEQAPPPGAVPTPQAAQARTIFLNRLGGTYTKGEPNDAGDNVASVLSPDLPAVDIPPWDIDEPGWQEVRDCVEQMFAPFAATITETDPGDALHVEAVIGGVPGQIGLPGTVAGVSPFLTNCAVIDDSIVFVFPSVIGDDRRRVCETIAQEVAHSFGLDHEFLCEDPMTYLTGCGDKAFRFQDAPCGEFEVRTCKCGQQTQNSAQMLLDRLGGGPAPALWVTAPAGGTLVAAGFPVRVAVTQTPVTLELYVDGVHAQDVLVEADSSPYREIDLATRADLRSGTHHVEVIARRDDDDQAVELLVEVEAAVGEELSGGCSAAGGGEGTAGGIVAAGALLLLAGGGRGRRGGRRRRRAGIALGLAGVAAAAGGCRTTVGGSPGGSINATCEGAFEVDPTAATVWTARGGVCAGVLIGERAIATAAHCVAEAAERGEPIVIVVRDRQYIALEARLYPAEDPDDLGGDDLAIAIPSRAIVELAPTPLQAPAPEPDGEVVLVGYGEWSPADALDPQVLGASATIVDLDDRAFQYTTDLERACLPGLGGGPVLAGEPDEGVVVGVHGGEGLVVRLDRRACWLACAAGAELSPASPPAGCDCAAADTRPCGDCGLETLDATTGTWSECAGAAEERRCAAGLICDPAGECVFATDPP